MQQQNSGNTIEMSTKKPETSPVDKYIDHNLFTNTSQPASTSSQTPTDGKSTVPYSHEERGDKIPMPNFKLDMTPDEQKELADGVLLTDTFANKRGIKRFHSLTTDNLPNRVNTNVSNHTNFGDNFVMLKSSDFDKLITTISDLAAKVTLLTSEQEAIKTQLMTLTERIPAIETKLDVAVTNINDATNALKTEIKVFSDSTGNILQEKMYQTLNTRRPMNVSKNPSPVSTTTIGGITTVSQNLDKNISKREITQRLYKNIDKISPEKFTEVILKLAKTMDPNANLHQSINEDSVFELKAKLNKGLTDNSFLNWVLTGKFL